MTNPHSWMSNKVKQVANGLFWTYAERMLAQLITLGVTVVLARLISPDEYGIISIVNIFINIANSFVINGFGNSLIQKKDADSRDFSTIFYFSVAFSFVIYAIVFGVSPWISSFYDMPELIVIIRTMGMGIPLAAINSIQQAYVSKRMEFKRFFFATLGGALASAVIGITMAYMGFGMWALVAQYLTNVSINTVILFFTSGWRPQAYFSLKRMSGLFSYGWRIMMVGVGTTVYSNLKNFIIGKKYSAVDLAYSEKGEQFPSAITGNINSSITKVLFPVLSDSQNEPYKLKQMVRRSIRISTYVIFPIMFGFSAVANNFVIAILTDKWAECIPYLVIMCIVYALQPLQTSSLQCVKALGQGGLYLKTDIVKKVIGIVLLVTAILFFDSAFAIILTSLILEVFSVAILLPLNKKLLNYTYKEQLADIFVNFSLIIPMWLCIWLISLLNLNSATELVVQVVVGALIYIGASVITKNDSMKYILDILRSKPKS